MEQRQLGETGLFVSAVGLGCNNFGGRVDQGGTQRVVDTAIETGINFFDTADVYGNQLSEVMLGKALGSRRHEVVVASKFGMPTGAGELAKGGSRRYVIKAAEASLKRLGTDYIDLYQMHFPDAHTPLAETLGALDDLVRAGKVRYVGHSNFSGWQIADAHWLAREAGCAPMVTAQNHYSLLERAIRHEVIPACEHFGVGILPYFPLGSGMLTGKYRRDEPPPQGTRLANMGNLAARAMSDRAFSLVEALSEYAHAQGRDVLTLAFSWLLSQPIISSVIAGATSAEQVVGNVAAASDWRLGPEEMQDIDKILGSVA
jgi:aryl-alcohol dehydrogenase-like predicted oxidoreductase